MCMRGAPIEDLARQEVMRVSTLEHSVSLHKSKSNPSLTALRAMYGRFPSHDIWTINESHGRCNIIERVKGVPPSQDSIVHRMHSDGRVLQIVTRLSTKWSDRESTGRQMLIDDVRLARMETTTMTDESLTMVVVRYLSLVDEQVPTSHNSPTLATRRHTCIHTLTYAQTHARIRCHHLTLQSPQTFYPSVIHFSINKSPA
jgi:hypothetical protein